MPDLQAHFIEVSIKHLNEIRNYVLARQNLTVADFNQYFRRLHTIKGTAQTFGLTAPAVLTHEIESYLAAAQNRQVEFNADLFADALAILQNSLSNRQFPIPEDFRRKIQVEQFAAAPEIFNDIPGEITDRLSVAEKSALFRAGERGESLHLLEMSCNLPDFPARLKSLRAQIEETAQMIAVLPQPLKNAQIGVRIICAGDLPDDITGTKIILRKPINHLTAEDLSSVLQLLAARTQKIAFERGKSVEIVSQIDRIKLSPEATEKIFGVLLHLSGNAVDHAIETPEERALKGKSAAGQIKISMMRQDENLLIRFADDGRGIDSRQAFETARRKNLIAADQNLSDAEKLQLIFLPGFTTAEIVSEISGRGVGLDVVREIVINLGGAINIESAVGIGTTFEILLPPDAVIENAE